MWRENESDFNSADQISFEMAVDICNRESKETSFMSIDININSKIYIYKVDED